MVKRLYQKQAKRKKARLTSNLFLKVIFAVSVLVLGSQSILIFYKSSYAQYSVDKIDGISSQQHEPGNQDHPPPLPHTSSNSKQRWQDQDKHIQQSTAISPAQINALIPRFIMGSDKKLPRVLAIVFPQFHPDPLNDKLWGKGFTDWDNLRAAPTKNRLGFEIPRPTELGYYDLRNSTVRRIQGELAKQYGIDGFVYHHYWFYDPSHPGPNLHAPLVEMLKDGYPDIPFCLHWCDSKWVDTWHGKTNSSGKGNNVLQEQFFPEETDSAIEEHYNWLKQFFHHPNYIKVDGQPVFMIYQRKARNEPVLKRLRELAIQDGFPSLYFALGMSFSHDELFPEGKSFGQRRLQYPRYLMNTTIAYPGPYDWLEGKKFSIPQWCLRKEKPPKGLRREIAGLLTSFDNTPRRDFETAHLWSADSPGVVVKRFYDSLYAAVYYETCCVPNKLPMDVDDDRLIMINSWNEWAEGMMLEPNTVFGRRFLEAARQVKLDIVAKGC